MKNEFWSNPMEIKKPFLSNQWYSTKIKYEHRICIRIRLSNIVKMFNIFDVVCEIFPILDYLRIENFQSVLCLCGRAYKTMTIWSRRFTRKQSLFFLFPWFLSCLRVLFDSMVYFSVVSSVFCWNNFGY